jgi:hypothetical protein
MRLCTGSAIEVNKPQTTTLTKPSREEALTILRDKAARQQAYRLTDLRLDETFNVEWSDKPLRFSSQSIARLAAVTGVPMRFMREESVKGGRAARRLAEIVNERLCDTGDGFTAVIDGGTIEGVLSPKYKRLPNYDAAEFALSRLDMSSREITRLTLEETRMAVDVVSLNMNTTPVQKSLLKVGDPLRNGISLFNSEDADSCLEVHTFLERLRCTNGATINERGDGFRLRHTGEAFFARYAALVDTMQTNESRVYDHLTTMRQTAISHEEGEVVFATLARDFSERFAVRVLDDAAANTAETPSELVTTAKQEPLRRNGTGDIISVYNVWNGITFQGHEAPDLRRRRAIEAYGGAFLTGWQSYIANG